MQGKVLLLLAVLGTGLLLVSPSVAQDYTKMEERSYQGVPYLTGGAGIGEREDLQARTAGRYNLKLIFALEQGDYLGVVDVKVQDRQGKTVLEATTEGPWLYTRLPAGVYRVEATARGKTLTREVKAGEQGLEEARFLW